MTSLFWWLSIPLNERVVLLNSSSINVLNLRGELNCDMILCPRRGAS